MIMEMVNWRVRRAARAIVPVKPAEYQYCDIEARLDFAGDGMAVSRFCLSLDRSRDGGFLVVTVVICLPVEGVLIKCRDCDPEDNNDGKEIAEQEACAREGGGFDSGLHI